MNIFALDIDPKKAAQYHNDKHVVKMILESAQLLCSAHHMTGGSAPYKLTHKNHPSSLWCRETKENYLWLKELAENLCAEYTHRTGKVHKSSKVINELSEPNIPPNKLTKFALAMPEQYKDEDPIKAYRKYYVAEKIFMKNGKRMDVWTKRDKPSWLDISAS